LLELAFELEAEQESVADEAGLELGTLLEIALGALDFTGGFAEL